MEISSNQPDRLLSDGLEQVPPQDRDVALPRCSVRSTLRSQPSGAPPPLVPLGSSAPDSEGVHPAVHGRPGKPLVPLFPRVSRRVDPEELAAAMARHPSGKKKEV